jgi:hypothetical protein
MMKPLAEPAMIFGGALTALAALVAIVRALAAPVAPPARTLNAVERRAVAEALARQEPRWRLDAEHLFPGDRWSQDDDFFNQEHRAVRGAAAARGTSVDEILRAVDEGLRAAPGSRKVSVAPVKPRPFYD